jgi:magnesium transporter
MTPGVSPALSPADAEFDRLLLRLQGLAVPQGARVLAGLPPATGVALLEQLSPATARGLLAAGPPAAREQLLAAAPAGFRELWTQPAPYGPDRVGHLLRPLVGVFPADLPAAAAIEAVRRHRRDELLTYLYATDAAGRLAGVVVLRDLFLAEPGARLADVMITPPFFLRPEMTVAEAMRVTVRRHYPVYPVCDADQRPLGLVPGRALFEKQTQELSAQSGKMEGVRAKERLSTGWLESLRFRHPWLQLNLLLSLCGAFVLAAYKVTLEQVILLAVFSPLVTAQARNTGAQTMAIVLRALQTGEPEEHGPLRLLWKEFGVGLVNGVLVGVVAGLIVAWFGRGGDASLLALGVVMAATMALACAGGAVLGVAVPLGLRAVGADPALAATIILATLSTMLSQFIYLSLGRWLLT